MHRKALVKLPEKQISWKSVGRFSSYFFAPSQAKKKTPRGKVTKGAAKKMLKELYKMFTELQKTNLMLSEKFVFKLSP